MDVDLTPDEYGRLSTIEKIALLPPDERLEILDSMSEAEMMDHRLWLRPAQMEVMDDDSPIVLMCAGRGAGKTRVGASWICEKAKVPGTRLHLVGRTVQDVREVMVQGESGIIAVSEPGFVPEYTPTLRRIVWPNDSKAITFTSETPDALRGPQSHYTWCDELATFKTKPDTSGANVWDNVKMSTRLGPRPQILCTTTPRRVPIVRELIRDARSDTFDRLVSLHGGSTLDNRANLSPVFVRNLLSMYEGTALARQELYGEFLDIVEGALWRDEDIVRYRVDEGEPDRPLTIIGVDPGVTTGGDATGIITIVGETTGEMADRRAWVVRDDTEEGVSPERWASRVIQVWREEYPAIVVAEKNQGGELVSSVLRNSPGGDDCPVLLVSARGSKAARAEPVLMTYRQRRVFHNTDSDLAQLEAEMTSWEPGTRGFSPNRLDAMVHAVRALLIDDRMLRSFGYIYAAEPQTQQVIQLSSARRDPERARASMRSWRSTR